MEQIIKLTTQIASNTISNIIIEEIIKTAKKNNFNFDKFFTTKNLRNIINNIEINFSDTQEKLNMTYSNNKGIGAGGSNTNKNGLSYEKYTDLNSEYNIISTNKHYINIVFKLNNKKVFKFTKQSNFFKCMYNSIDKNIEKGHGCKSPDECYINEQTKKIFILEKKFQQVNGSVCEKIQTSHFKKWQYSRSFPEYTIVYIYCLSKWFKKNCKAELEYLNIENVPFFFGNDIDYKKKIVGFIIK